jgi:hypothetical protein
VPTSLPQAQETVYDLLNALEHAQILSDYVEERKHLTLMIQKETMHLTGVCSDVDHRMKAVDDEEDLIACKTPSTSIHHKFRKQL